MPETKHVRMNAIFSQLYPIRCRYMVVYGGRTNGKSVGVSQLLQRRGCEHVRHVLVLRKFATSIRLSTWARVKRAIDETVGLASCDVNKSDRHITLPTSSTWDFVGADDPEKLKSVEGITDVWLEEANEFTEEDFDNLDIGLRGVSDWLCQFWLTFNPIPVIAGRMHWLQKRFRLTPDRELGKVYVEGDTCVLRTYFRHNAFCPEASRNALAALEHTNPRKWRMWGLGEFLEVEGAILGGLWDVTPGVPDGVDFLGLGLDFGFSADPAALVAVWRHKYELWVQQLIYSTGLTNQALSAMMLALGVKKHELIVADSAEPKSIQELVNDGWNVIPSEKGPDYKRAAALKLQDYRIHALQDSLDLQAELGMWQWEKDKNERPLPVVRDGDDHTIDAMLGIVMKRVANFFVSGVTIRDSARPTTAGLRGRRF